MKPIKLKISGLNSFIQEEVIDFSELTSRGLFGIFGPTGSGKSSILDAITMALYGNISRDTTEFINTETDNLYVYFEFSMGSRNHYTVERKIRRKQDGGYSTTFCRLVCNEDGKEEIIDKYKEIDQAVENRVIGLKHKDFIKSVVLPQGKFSEFLKLTGRTRRDMLERILGLEEFGRKLEDKIKSERNERNDRKKEYQTLLTQFEEYTEESVLEMEEEQKEYKQKRKSIEGKLKEKIDLLNEYQEIWKAQQSLAAQREEQDKLENDIGDIDEKKLLLENGRKALSLKPYFDNLKKYTQNQHTYQQQISQLNTDVEQLSDKEIKIKENYEEIQRRREKEIPRLEKLKTEIGQAIKLQKENQDSKEIYDNKEKEYQQKKEGYDQVSDLINQLETRINKGKTLLKEKEEKVDTLEISTTFRRQAANGLEIEKDIQDEKEELAALIEDKNDLIEEIDNEKNILIKKEREKDKIQKELERVYRQLNVENEGQPRTEKEIYSDKEKLTRFKQELENCQNYLLKKDSNDLRIKEYQEKKQEYKLECEDIKQIIKQREEQISSLRHELRDLEIRDMSVSLAQDLEDGKPCPVCGSKEHPHLAEKGDMVHQDIKKETIILEEELSELHKKQGGINSALSSIEENIIQLEEDNRALLDNITDCVENFEEYTSLFKNYDIDIIISSKTLSSEKLEKLSESYRRVKDLIVKEEKRLDEWKEKKEELILAQEKYQKEINQFDIDITRINEKVKQLSLKNTNIEDKIKENTNSLDLLVKKYREILSEISSRDKENIPMYACGEQNVGKYNIELLNIESQINEVKKIDRNGDNEIILNNFEHLNNEIADADREREKCMKDIVDYKNRLDSLNSSLKENEAKKSKLELNLQEISISMQNLEEKINENQRIINEVIEDRVASEYLQEVEKQQQELLNREKDMKNTYDNLQEELTRKKSELDSLKSTIENNRSDIESIREYIDKRIVQYGYNDIADAEKYILSEDELKNLEDDIDLFNKRITEINGKIKIFEEVLQNREIKEEEINLLEEKKDELEKEYNNLIGVSATIKDKIELFQKKLSDKKRLVEKLESVEKELALISEIMDLISANKFVEFVALRQLNYIAHEASRRLLDITNDRYQLELDINGEFVICDNYNGGVKRDCNTLSGGETFLTSLALALSLSSHIQLKGKAQMEFFFLDEGFGTLDRDLLDIVMNSLENLKEERLSVGIITHVEELKNRVPIRLNVIPAEPGLHGTKVEMICN